LLRIGRFAELLSAENKVQNLTRLTTPEEFVEGHLLDVKELLESGWIEYPAADLGSGGGVPGLLAAAIEPGAWILVEAEKRKAQFLSQAAQTLGLRQVQVVADRIEKSGIEAKSVIARAVGSVEKIYSWLRQSSTWNKLILLKGPKWEEEWAAFSQSKYRSELQIVATRAYTVGKEEKRRLLVKLTRVPRGTRGQRR